MSDVSRLVDELRTLTIHTANPAKAYQTLQATKVALLKLQSMPPSAHRDPRELSFIRDTYEIGALLSLRMGRGEDFEHHVAMLKTLYLDYADVIPASTEQWRILSLYLTHLLAENKITEFHTELEQIPVEVRDSHFLAFAIALEQYFMEGNYNKVRETKQQVPDADFAACVAKLIDAINHEVARNMEKAYQWLSFASARKLLSLSSDAELLQFIEKQHSEKRDVEWRLEHDRVVFVRGEHQGEQELPKWQIMNEALGIATEIERIV